MNERTLRVLEYPKIIQLLKGLTTFPPGMELAVNLAPTASVETVQARLQETAEALHLLDDRGAHPLAGARDVRQAVGRAARGGVLSGPELLDVAETVTVVGRCRRLLLDDAGDARGPWPRLADLARQLRPLPALSQTIRASIGEDGEVLDRASDKLARLRTQIQTWQARSRERIEAVLRSAASRQLLQESLVTVRNDRYVLPVKVEHKAAVPGIVHDVSSSGATVFVEPLAIVELNNKVKEARVEEEREVERILRHLSGLVAAEETPLQQGAAALARLDLALAKALLAQRLNGIQPELGADGRLELMGARHPLLPGPVVPIDVWLGRDTRVLVITGPNTGGKTVTLKTMGLLSLMAQSGLFVPAQRAVLPVYSGIYADIGDEQSIEQSLSTFSSHMANIVDILHGADADSLVLLDELGAGTDPAEGAALAMAILQHLADRGISAVATTHYSELKAFVHDRPFMQNASVEFDAQTLAPTYRLLMGTPGRSNALEIAARLGLPAPILAAARGQFAKADDVRTEDLLRDLEAARRAAREEREAASQSRREAEALRARLADMKATLDAQRAEWTRQARIEAQQVWADARQETEKIIADLRRRADASGVEQARAAHRHMTERLAALQQPPSKTDGQDSGSEAFTPQVGGQVQVRTLRQQGTVLAGPHGDGDWTVQVGTMRIIVAGADLAPPPGTSALKKTRATPRSHSTHGRTPAGSAAGGLLPTKRLTIEPELHLRGMPVDEALYELEKYLDDALLAGLDRVLIVHGKGTGALRRAVHGFVQGHPHVKNWHMADQSSGGYGATVVEL